MVMEQVRTKNLPEGVDLLVLDGSGDFHAEVGLEELPRYFSDPKTLIWCNISSTEGGRNGIYGQLLREIFGFDELTIEYCFTRSHLRKVDVYEEYLFMVLFSFHLSEKRRRVGTIEVNMYIGDNYVVCVHPRPLRELDRVRRQLLARSGFVSSSPANVAHAVLDAVVDEYLPVMSRLSAMVDGIEDELLGLDEGAPDTVLDSLFHLKHDLIALRWLAVPLREIIGILLRPTTRHIPEESAAYHDDVRDHLNRVVDMIDTLRDYLMGSLDIYTTQQTRRNAEETRRVNQSVARLTAVSTIFLPLTFITGIYRINFEYMPETQWEYGFYAILGLCMLLGISMLNYLRRKKII